MSSQSLAVHIYTKPFCPRPASHYLVLEPFHCFQHARCEEGHAEIHAQDPGQLCKIHGGFLEACAAEADSAADHQGGGDEMAELQISVSLVLFVWHKSFLELFCLFEDFLHFHNTLDAKHDFRRF